MIDINNILICVKKNAYQNSLIPTGSPHLNISPSLFASPSARGVRHPPRLGTMTMTIKEQVPQQRKLHSGTNTMDTSSCVFDSGLTRITWRTNQVISVILPIFPMTSQVNLLRCFYPISVTPLKVWPITPPYRTGVLVLRFQFQDPFTILHGHFKVICT